MKTALSFIKTLAIGFIVWVVAIPIIYYIGMFCKYLSKVLGTDYWQSIIQGAAAITILGCFAWTIGYVFLYVVEWILFKRQQNKRGKKHENS